MTATGGSQSAGIGAGRDSDGGTIRIYGGTVNTTGKDSSAGIGGGDARSSRADFSTIEIHGGKVTATGNSKGSGIGGGEYGSATITITGGSVTATGGSTGGAGIGSGVDGIGSTVTITGGSVVAKCFSGGHGIGNGKNTSASNPSHITLGYTDETRTGMSVTSDSYAGVLHLEQDFINENTSVVNKKGTYYQTVEGFGNGTTLAPTALVTYLDPFNGERKQFCIFVRPGLLEWSNGWYSVNADVNIEDEIVVNGNDVNLILENDCTMNAWNIKVSDPNKITIWGQNGDRGKLNAIVPGGKSNIYKAAIGGSGTDCGTIIINGGTVTATGGNDGWQGSAGIGACMNHRVGTIIINGGNITATGAETAAGIGGGGVDPQSIQNPIGGTGRVEIHGGTVTAWGTGGGAGIGSGATFDGGPYEGLDKILITGGTVNAYGSNFVIYSGFAGYTDMGTLIGSGAGIGGGFGSSAGNIEITGGIVNGFGSWSAPAIGTGGTTLGDKPNTGGIITISGGTVNANEDAFGYGIGGGNNGGGVSINISGGKIHTYGRGNVGIGTTSGGQPCTTTLSWTESSLDTMSIWANSWNGTVKLEKYFTDGKTYLEPGDIGDPNVLNSKTLKACVKPSIPYVDGSGAAKEAVSDYTFVHADTDEWSAGWYVVKKETDITVPDRIITRGDVNLILCDGAKLTASKGIKVSRGNSLTIWAQSHGKSSGVLLADASGYTAENANYAGIGGDGHNDEENGIPGTIVINGGVITAKGGTMVAGIGGGQGSDFGEITITGGTVDAEGGRSGGAGIGGGQDGKAGTIRITGGHVTAKGGELENGIRHDGIGSGSLSSGAPQASIVLDYNSADLNMSVRSNGYSGAVSLKKAFVDAEDSAAIFQNHVEDTGTLADRTLVPLTTGLLTVSYEADDQNAAGHMPSRQVATGSLFPLPACDYNLPGKAFKEWSVKIGNNEAIRKPAG